MTILQYLLFVAITSFIVLPLLFSYESKIDKQRAKKAKENEFDRHVESAIGMRHINLN